MIDVGIWMLTPPPLSGPETYLVVHSPILVTRCEIACASSVVNSGDTGPSASSTFAGAELPAARAWSTDMMLLVVVSTSAARPSLLGTTLTSTASPLLNVNVAFVGATSVCRATSDTN